MFTFNVGVELDIYLFRMDQILLLVGLFLNIYGLQVWFVVCGKQTCKTDFTVCSLFTNDITNRYICW